MANILRNTILVFVIFFMNVMVHGENHDIDTLSVDPQPMVSTADSVFDSLPWWRQLYDNGFRIHDSRVNYPKFARELLKIYDWGDKTFNTYDPNYVVGVGKNWKVVLKSYNWLTSYMMRFEDGKSLHIRSDLYPDMGVYLCFMAVNVGYTAKIDNLFGNKRKTRENLNFSFTTSRFHAAFNYWKTKGDAKITKFGDYNNSLGFHMPFNNIGMQSYNGELFYFFNNKKYSHAAAYCFSKYQLKSAGSLMAGFTFNHQTLDIDFSNISEEIKDYIPGIQNRYRFRFNDYALAIGYGYNWVIKPRKWLLNVMALPSLGYRYSYSDSSEGKRNMFAFDAYAAGSIVYNMRALYASMNVLFNGHLYFNKKYLFFDSISSLSINVGARF